MIRRADVFVFYDDVQYDKHGWRNRNRIKAPGGSRWLTIPVHGKGNTTGRPINEIEIDWTQDWRKGHLGQLRASYARAPYAREIWPVVESVYATKHTLLAELTISSTIAIANYLNLSSVEFVRSSSLGLSGTKTARLVAALEAVRATRYISGPSAKAYIENQLFEKSGIGLSYIDYSYEPYEQLHPPYDPAVSILDALFMAGPHASRLIQSLSQLEKVATA